MLHAESTRRRRVLTDSTHHNHVNRHRNAFAEGFLDSLRVNSTHASRNSNSNAQPRRNSQRATSPMNRAAHQLKSVSVPDSLKSKNRLWARESRAKEHSTQDRIHPSPLIRRQSARLHARAPYPPTVSMTMSPAGPTGHLPLHRRCGPSSTLRN
jgi:hypothetical protein